LTQATDQTIIKKTNIQSTNMTINSENSNIVASTQEISHDPVTLALAKKESAHHREGIYELYAAMRHEKSLKIQAYALDDTSAPPLTQSNVKVCHFLRHGQGFHNLLADMYSLQGREWAQFVPSPDNPYVRSEIVDAPLTQKGRNQARAVNPLIRNMVHQPELIVLSSHCRALQTGLIAFEHLIKTSVPMIAHEMVREQTGVHVCDMRRTRCEQENEFPRVDFGLIEDEQDQLFQSGRRETKMEVGERVYSFLQWLEQRSETHVGIVSHSGWLMTLFNGCVKCDDSLKDWFQTGELRSVKLEFVKNKKE
jgi:broad specificity phosphatase PhoE